MKTYNFDFLPNFPDFTIDFYKIKIPEFMMDVPFTKYDEDV